MSLTPCGQTYRLHQLIFRDPVIAQLPFVYHTHTHTYTFNSLSEDNSWVNDTTQAETVTVVPCEIPLSTKVCHTHSETQIVLVSLQYFLCPVKSLVRPKVLPQPHTKEPGTPETLPDKMV